MMAVRFPDLAVGDDARFQSDAALIAACLAGDESAWEVLVLRYGRLIYSIPLKYGLGENDAADVFQTVCVTLLEKLPALRDPSKLASWLITTTSRECWATANRRNRTAPLPRTEEDEEPVEAPDDGPLPDEVLLRLEEQQSVRQCLQQLPERCRVMLWHLYYDRSEPSYAEIGRRLGMPEASVGPTRMRCLNKLRAMLSQQRRVL